jgi:hypothetical protein
VRAPVAVVEPASAGLGEEGFQLGSFILPRYLLGVL